VARGGHSAEKDRAPLVTDADQHPAGNGAAEYLGQNRDAARDFIVALVDLARVGWSGTAAVLLDALPVDVRPPAANTLSRRLAGAGAALAATGASSRRSVRLAQGAGCWLHRSCWQVALRPRLAASEEGRNWPFGATPLNVPRWLAPPSSHPKTAFVRPKLRPRTAKSNAPSNWEQR
jgi:hypothetical protein